MANRPGQGRKPKPSVFKKMNGSAAHDPQRVNAREPDAAAAGPVMPAGWGGELASAWEWLAAQAKQYQIFSASYQVAMEEFCRNWAMLKAAENEINTNGLVVSDANGNPKRNPAAADLHKSADNLHRYLAEFGITPSSKQRITAESVTEQAPLKMFLNGAS